MPRSALWSNSKPRGRYPATGTASPSPARAASACSRLSFDEIISAARSAPSSAKPAQTRNASWKPSVSAIAWLRSPRGERVVGGGRGDRGGDGQAQSAAHLLARVDQPGRQAGLVGPHPGDRGDRGRDEREAQADRREQRREQDVADVGSARRDLGEPEGARCHEQQARDQHGLEPDPRDELGRHPGAHDDRERQRDVGQARLERLVAQHLLHVQRDEEEHREQRDPDQQPGDVRSAQGAQPEDAERHQRLGRARLDHQERGEQRRGQRKQADRSAWSPSRPARRRRARRP